MAMQTEITMNTITAGTFCWNEMATGDTQTASDFYCALFGWEATKDDCCGMDYTVFKKDGHPVGGMMAMDDNWPADTPSHWGSYIAVDDVDATAEKITACGGTLCCGPQDAGEEGRFAVMTDPTGATISIFKGGDGKNAWGHGAFCWNELLTTDMDVAGVFYEKMFGWNAQASHTSEEPYAVFMNGEAWAGGMMNMHWEGKPSWLGYVSVADVDMTTSKAIELGATVCVEPADIPGIGRFSVFTDPVGSTIAVFTGLSECCGDSCG
ncbi:MAG: VOC family protein [Planctomycetes bacterium]|nr:VOC family protein [Planctomycetota bacterium]